MALVLLAAFAVLILAPAVFAGAMAPIVTLKGPLSVDLNATFTVNGTVKNTNGGKGSTYVTIQKKSNNAWKKVTQVKADWLNGNKGIFSAKLKATNPTMSLIKYRAVWAAGGVNGYSKTLIIAVQ
ncbi:MAG: hypothetical protein NTW58_02735 [Actinobacteria bacterium]|nr:hypothetical protein [Actinomycetota bacterium]